MRRLRKPTFALLALLLLLGGVGLYLWRSPWLANTIRTRAIAEIEKATGTTASFGSFAWDWERGVLRLADITVRGHEAPTDPPFVHVAAAEISLKVLSFLSPHVDLRAVKLTKPEIHIVTYPDGSTNLPRRRQRPPDQVLDELFRLGINRLDVSDGLFSWNQQQVPFAVRGENLDIALGLEGERYRGTLAGERLALKVPGVRQFAVDLATSVTLDSHRVQFERLRASLDGLQLDAQGQVENWLEPKLTATVNARGPVEALVRHFDLPLLAQGDADASGELSYERGWKFSGKVAGRNLGYRQEAISVQRVNVSGVATYSYSPRLGHRAEVSQLRADSPQGSFRGSLLAGSERYRLRGTLANLQFDEAQHFFDPTLPSWASLVHGPVDIESDYRFVKATAHLTLIPTDGERTLSGAVNLVYDSRAQDVQLANTHLQSGFTQVDVAGDLLGGLDVNVTTANLAELPFVNRLPVRIENGGTLSFRGEIRGGLANPAAQGRIEAQAINYQGEAIERARAMLNARANLLELKQLEVTRGGQSVSGAVEVSLFDWETRPASVLRGQISGQGIEVAPLAPDTRGRLKGLAELSGTLQDPKLEGNLEWIEASYQGQPLGTVTGRVTYSGEQIDVRNGRLLIDRQPLDFAGTYIHEPNDYRNGAFQANGKGSGLFLERLSAFHERFPLIAGRLELDARARGRLTNGQPDFNSLDGRAVIQQAAYDGKALGALSVHAKSDGGQLNLTASGLLRGASVTGSSQWQLKGLMPGQGQFALQGAKFDDFQDLLSSSATPAEPGPFDIRLEATGTVRGSLREPSAMTGSLQVSQLAITPRQAMSDAARRDFTLRNDGPLEIRYDAKGLDLKQARFSAKDTKLSAAGLLSTQGNSAANFRVTGDANLAVLSALKADLLATGNSTLDLTLRGSLAQPQMAGRMELRDASFFLRDVPNGLEKVNGVVFFDRSRARLENLTAQSGGGTIRLGGFIGFAGELTYQLQAQADNVRVRYPEGVSTAVNTSLTLAGSATRSLLSGSVTLLRAALSPRTDLGTLITESGKASVAAPRVENEFLKNMNFDVRVDTALNAQVTTSLTQNVEAEVNLRLRGTPARPVLLGRTSFTQGEISFFGTKYSIDRGEVNFYNQTKVEPTINLDLQTRVRGVVVTINFSGPASKLNLSYRSDPPLQSSEILALLTVGRTPNGSVASGANVQSPTFLQGASSALLGQAVAAPITGRLQRLFGVSRVRIDPQLTGIENTAQARLTIEQQVSRDITVTFITNLNRTQQQIVSVEWDFSREFSALAIRDENGVFGLDFFYRKRFK